MYVNRSSSILALGSNQTPRSILCRIIRICETSQHAYAATAAVVTEHRHEPTGETLQASKPVVARPPLTNA